MREMLKKVSEAQKPPETKKFRRGGEEKRKVKDYVQFYERQHKEGLITASQRDTLIQGYDYFWARVDDFFDSSMPFSEKAFDAQRNNTFAGAGVLKAPDDRSGKKEIRILLLTVGPDEEGKYAIKTLEITLGSAHALRDCLEDLFTTFSKREQFEKFGFIPSQTPSPKRSGRRKRKVA